MNEFVDGAEASEWDDLQGGGDRAFLIKELEGGVLLYSYVTDIYDEANCAIWMDIESILSDLICRRAGVYVVGSDGRSALIDATMKKALGSVAECTTLVIHGHTPFSGAQG